MFLLLKKVLDLECALGSTVISMEAELTIQQVATQTGLSVHTLRYYERNGLLEPVSRAANGHRRYSADDLARIELLNRLRTTGMPIRQMQRLALSMRENPSAIGDRRAILEAHEREVQHRIQELSQNLAVIQKKIRHYQELEAREEDEQAHLRARSIEEHSATRL